MLGSVFKTTNFLRCTGRRLCLLTRYVSADNSLPPTLTSDDYWTLLSSNVLWSNDPLSVFCAHALWIEHQTLSAAGVVAIHCNDWWPCKITLLLHQNEILAIARPSACDRWPVPYASADIKVTRDDHVPMHAATYISGVWTIHVCGSGKLAATLRLRWWSQQKYLQISSKSRLKFPGSESG